MPTHLPNMSVNASAAVFWDEDSDHYWPRIIFQQLSTMSTGFSAIVASALKRILLIMSATIAIARRTDIRIRRPVHAPRADGRPELARLFLLWRPRPISR
jgi:hypothetical protein